MTVSNSLSDSGLAPSFANAGSTETITLINFSHVSDVKFNSVPASFAIHSNNKLTVTVPDAAISGLNSAANRSGTGTTGYLFTMVPSFVTLKLMVFNPSKIKNYEKKKFSICCADCTCSDRAGTDT